MESVLIGGKGKENLLMNETGIDEWTGGWSLVTLPDVCAWGGGGRVAGGLRATGSKEGKELGDWAR